MQVFKKQKGVLTVLGILTIFAAVFCISISAKAIIDCEDAPESPWDPPETGWCDGGLYPCCYCCSPINYCTRCSVPDAPCDPPCSPCKGGIATCILSPGGYCVCFLI